MLAVFVRLDNCQYFERQYDFLLEVGVRMEFYQQPVRHYDYLLVVIFITIIFVSS